MIKVETIGMIEISKNNPVLKSENDVANYSFLTVDDITYLIANTMGGDASYVRDGVIPAGEFLNGYDLSAWVGQKLVIDEKHIAYGDGEDYEDITAGETMLTIDETTGALEITDEAPESGYYFVVTDLAYLTEKAVKGVITVGAPAEAAAGGGGQGGGGGQA